MTRTPSEPLLSIETQFMGLVLFTKISKVGQG